ncbi:hypothetical protein SLA2020_411840 [Shorea laevis]
MSTSWVVVHLLLFLALADFALSKSFFTRWFDEQFPTYTVHITSGIRSPVWCHCKSGDYDLGEHQLNRNEEFYFQFKSNIFRSTRFFCSCRWPKRNKFASFDVFNAAKLFRAVHCFDGLDCFWKLRSAGIYASQDGGKNYTYKMYEWQ